MKNALELGITTKERNGLVKVRDGLASGEYRHVENPYSAGKSKKLSFNMNHWFDKYESCGTVGCIGGWTEKVIKCELESYSTLEGLTHPLGIGDWDKITPAKAAKAIDHFLNGEKDPWAFMRGGQVAA